MMKKKAGRGNTSRLANIIMRMLVVGQIALTAGLLIAATLQIQIDPQSAQAQLRLRENAVYTARMACWKGLH